MTIFCGYYCLIFLRIGPKAQNFVPANICYIHTRTLECVDPEPFPHTNRKISTRKTRSKPESQTNVSANNCHPKVPFSGNYVRIVYYYCGMQNIYSNINAKYSTAHCHAWVASCRLHTDREQLGTGILLKGKLYYARGPARET